MESAVIAGGYLLCPACSRRWRWRKRTLARYRRHWTRKHAQRREPHPTVMSWLLFTEEVFMSLTHDEMTLGPDAYSSVSSRATITYTRVYRRGGQYAHLRELVISAGCEGMDEYPVWYGTGSQAEYEHAASMPLCPRCFRVREGGGQDPVDRDPRLGSAHGVEMT